MAEKAIQTIECIISKNLVNLEKKLEEKTDSKLNLINLELKSIRKEVSQIKKDRSQASKNSALVLEKVEKKLGIIDNSVVNLKDTNKNLFNDIKSIKSQIKINCDSLKNLTKRATNDSDLDSVKKRIKYEKFEFSVAEREQITSDLNDLDTNLFDLSIDEITVDDALVLNNNLSENKSIKLEEQDDINKLEDVGDVLEDMKDKLEKNEKD